MFFLELLPFSVRHIHFRKVGRGGGHLQVLKKIYRPRVIFKVLGPPWENVPRKMTDLSHAWVLHIPQLPLPCQCRKHNQLWNQPWVLYRKAPSIHSNDSVDDLTVGMSKKVQCPSRGMPRIIWGIVLDKHMTRCLTGIV
jgi:hypothetical protein